MFQIFLIFISGLFVSVLLFFYTSRFLFNQMINKTAITLLSLLFILVSVNSNSVRHLSSSQDLATGLSQNQKRIWVVYSGSSNNPAVQDVAEVLRGMIQVATITSSEQSLKVYVDDRENPISYNGDLTSEGIVKFVLEHLDNAIAARSEVARALKANQQFQQKQAQRAKKQWEEEQGLRKKSDTVVLTASTWSSFVNTRQPWVINFYEANCSACIELNKDWELISTAFKGRIRVAKLNISQEDNHVLEEQIQLGKYPSVRFYKEGPKKVSEFALFEGVHKRFSIQQWLNAKLNQKSTEVQIPRLNKQNYEALCKSTKNTCIVVFLENEDTQTLKKIEELSLQNIKKPITFVLSMKGDQDAFASQVGVASYPDTVMLYCKQKKLFRMGGLDFAAIKDTINQISNGNRNGFVKFPFAEPSFK